MSITETFPRLIGRDDIAFGKGAVTTDGHTAVRVNASHLPFANINGYVENVPYRPTEILNAGFNEYGTYGTAACLSAAITACGSDPKILYVPPGTWTISSNVTVGSNIWLQVDPDAVFDVADKITLTINGPILAGPFQMFSWSGTGAIDISSSPTVDCPIEWWGAITGTTEDCTTAFDKVDDCVGPHQNVRLGRGLYRITSAITWIGRTFGTVRNGFGLIGDGSYSAILVDTAGSIGLTVGATGVNSYEWRIKNVGFVGEAACCTNGLKVIRAIIIDMDNVYFQLGSTDYACVLRGTDYGKYRLVFGESSPPLNEYGVTWGTMANNLQIIQDTTQYFLRSQHYLDVLMSGTTLGTNGITIESAGASDNFVITGCIENVTNGIVATNCYGLTIKDIHFEGATCPNPFVFNNVRETTISSVNANNVLQTSTFINCDRITVEESILGNIVIYPGCYGMIFRNVSVPTTGTITDLSGCAKFVGRTGYSQGATSLNATFASEGRNPLNLITNHYLSRWTASQPVDWEDDAEVTYTQCGTGLVDTTRHLTTYCVKYVTAAGSSDAYTSYTLSTEQLQAVQGQVLTASCYFMVPSGQTFTAVNACSLSVTSTCAAWAASTAYSIGEAVLETGSGGTAYHFVCVRAGTTGVAGSEPTWTGYTLGDEVDEGGIAPKWIVVNVASSTSPQIFKTAQADNTWRKAVASAYIPKNATDAYLVVGTYDQTGGALDGTIYMAEPGMWIGSEPSRGIHQGQDDHETFVQIGNKRLWSESPAVGTWIAVGDIDLSTGQRCTVAGTMGVATWANFP